MAIRALKAERCYPYLTQPQTLQPRFAGITLAGMAGIWYGVYPSNGVELLELRYDAASRTLSAKKLTGNRYVPAGQITWEATPTGCRIVSSAWANVYTPRWDACKLTMYEDQLSLDLGGSDDEGLTFVRARTPLLLGWDDPRAPTHGLASHYAACGIEPEQSAASMFDEFRRWLHHSHRTVIIDQLLVCFPVLLVGSWQLLQDSVYKPYLMLLVVFFGALAVLRLQYVGWMS